MTQEGLIQAFTNPMQFASDPNMTADIVLGTVNQVSNAIDEFVTGSLRNNLLGLPLDLAALNIARGRDTGVAPLNLVRNQLFAETGEASSKPTSAGPISAASSSTLNHWSTSLPLTAPPQHHRQHVRQRQARGSRALIQKGTIGLQFDPFNASQYRRLQLHAQPGCLREQHKRRPCHSLRRQAVRTE